MGGRGGYSSASLSYTITLISDFGESIELLPTGTEMQSFEYLQINIDYYSSSDVFITPSNEKEIVVWKGFQDYINFLNTQGLDTIEFSKN